MTDLDGAGKVTAEEFASAWQSLMDEMVSQIVQQVGLSPASIVLTAIGVGILFVVVVAFIFLALSGWSNNASLSTSAFQSALIAISGRAAVQFAAVRKDSNLDEALAVVWGEQRTAVKDD